MISYSEAKKLIDNAIKIANDKNVVISVAVCDDHGELVAFARMDPVGFQTATLARAKAYTAARMKKSSKELGEWAVNNQKDISHWADQKITGLAGGLPVIKGERVIGGMGVSGLSPEDDEMVVVMSLKKSTFS